MGNSIVEMEQEQSLDRTMLNELVHWVKTLKEVGVSPDVAATVATKFFVAVCSSDCHESWEEFDYDEDDDDEDDED